MKNLRITITINDNGHPSFDFDPNMPYILADKIKETVENYYK